jgi:hypothetical protein
MTKMIETVTPEIGQAYKVARKTNALGQAVTGTRTGDWSTVLITAENLATYTATTGITYYVQPCRERHAARLLAAGWYRFSQSRGQCGEAIVTRGPLFGLACAKPAYWCKGEGPAMCANHGVLHLA